jgi:hypothetical protein
MFKLLKVKCLALAAAAPARIALKFEPVGNPMRRRIGRVGVVKVCFGLDLSVPRQ